MRRFFRNFLLGLFISVCLSTPVLAEQCPNPPFHISPFGEVKGLKKKSAKSDVGLVVSVLLKEYLSHAKKLPPNLSIEGALSGQANHYQADIVQGSHRYAGAFDFPDTLNDFLIDVALQIAKDAGAKLKAKDLLPYLNKARSPETYIAYAQGMTELESSTPGSLRKAVSFFEKAIENDYNHVSAYLGLSEALATMGNSETRARRELEKAKILNPVLAKNKTSRIEQLLKGERKEPCRQ